MTTGNSSALFSGRPRVSAIVSAYSSGGVNALGINTTVNAKILAAAALVANTLQTALSITGKGSVNFAHAQTSSGTTKAIRLKITVDGRVIFDATSSAATGSPAITGVGSVSDFNGAVKGIFFQPIAFATSLLIEVASTVTEATGVNTYVNYEVHV